MPAIASSYGVKDPAANPAKGFSTGFTDQQLIFLASRDLGRAHFDFNAVGTIAGTPHGTGGAAQFGLALSFAATRKLALVLESVGGPQPCTSDRYGSALTGVSFAFRPRLAFDAAYTRVYTAGAPRAQWTAGFTFAKRAPTAPLPSGSRLARWLGR